MYIKVNLKSRETLIAFSVHIPDSIVHIWSVHIIPIKNITDPSYFSVPLLQPPVIKTLIHDSYILCSFDVLFLLEIQYIVTEVKVVNAISWWF